MSKKGKIVILASPSGGGKTTMTKRLLRDFSVIKFSVSATTRPPRSGEEHGVHYFFLSEKKFRDKIDSGAFLEWEEFYNGTLYGTLRESVENELKKGYFILLDVDVLGALNVKKMYGDEALSLFIAPPSIDILKDRLISRGTEDEDSLNVRLGRAEQEIDFAQKFDEVVVNDDLETAYNEIKQIIKTFINE